MLRCAMPALSLLRHADTVAAAEMPHAFTLLILMLPPLRHDAALLIPFRRCCCLMPPLTMPLRQADADDCLRDAATRYDCFRDATPRFSAIIIFATLSLSYADFLPC